jgi:hypothetical protein
MTRIGATRLAASLSCSGMRPLSAVLEETRVVRALRDASIIGSFLYALRPDGTVVAYPVARWTPKRIYFIQARI